MAHWPTVPKPFAQLTRRGLIVAPYLVAAGMAHAGWAALLDRPLLAQRGTAILGFAGLLVLVAGPHRRSAGSAAVRAARDTAAAEVRDEAMLQRRHRVQAVVNAGLSMRLVFQPIIDLRSGRCVGHEALARFDGAGPEAWFAEAHALGIGVELELAAVERALRSESLLAGYLSLNLSPAALMSASFGRLIEERQCADSLVLELTEHAIVEDYEEVRAVVAALREKGVRVAVDDAGSGFASMRHILALTPEIIKLDRSLISAIDSDPARRGLARSLAQFACEIGADLVAEGVERGEELAACRDVGIGFAQGFLLGQPGPPPPVPSSSILGGPVRSAMTA